MDKHKAKVKLARKMNQGHKSGHFQTNQWESRKQGIATRVKKTEKNQKKGK